MDKTVHLSVIYMASGFGKRFGKNKLLEEFQGKKLYRYGLERFVEWQRIEAQKKAEKQKNKAQKEAGKQKIEAKQKAGKMEIRIVLVSQYQEILDAGKTMGLICVENRQAAEGITASIRLGLMAAGEADYYLFSVADQPWLKRETIESFVWRFMENQERYSIGCLCAENGKRGNPVIFHRRYREELLALRGDRGGSQVIGRHPEEVFYVLAEEEQMRDIDRLSDMRHGLDDGQESL